MTRLYFDVETYQKDEVTGKLKPILDCNSFTIGCVNIENKYEFYEDKEAMRKRILEFAKKEQTRHRRTYLYAHNAQYDTIAVFLPDIKAGKIKILRENPTIMQHEETGLTILDTMALVNKRLSEIGTMLGIEKLKMPGEINSSWDLRMYLQRDVEITKKLVEYIVDNMAEMGIKCKSIWTTPQLAMVSFLNYLSRTRTGYDILEMKGKKGVEMIKPSYNAEIIIRHAYRLGRCEAFKVEKIDNAYMIDQNRQFPYAATIMKVPDMRHEYYLKDALNYVEQDTLLSNYVGVAKCKVEVKEGSIGILPIRTQEYEMIHPKKGIIRGYWTFVELEQAVRYGYKILEIEEAVFYPISKRNPFKDYFEWLYEIELKHPEKKIITKLLMNGLIGKFGQVIRDTEMKIANRDDFRMMKEAGYEVIGEIENKFIYGKTEDVKLPSYGNVLLAAQIIATARVQMNDHLVKIPKEDLMYTDTDSIIMKGDYLRLYPIGNKLGEFKIVKDWDETPLTGVELRVIKEKLFKIRETLKMGGLSKKIQEEVDVLKLLDNGQKITQPKIIGIMEAIRTGKVDKIGTFEQEEYRITPKMKCQIELPDYVDETGITRGINVPTQKRDTEERPGTQKKTGK